MIPRDEEAAATTKQETSTTTASTSTWSGTRSKDPRIVRVSRAFGGKDRHSKVCTVRGLRDRRVRLSVPTAIQLYDLQDRLGLSQPSKVVDWLLEAAKHEIDELPPLQFPPGCLIGPAAATFQPMMGGFQDFVANKSKVDETSVDWEPTTTTNQVNDYFGRQNYPYSNSFVRSAWDEPSEEDQTSISLGLAAANHHSFGFLQPGPSSGLFAYHHNQQTGISTTQPYFPNNNNAQFDPNKDSDNFQTSSSEQMSNNVRPFQFSMTANLLPSHNNNNAVSDENKHNDL